MVRGSLGMAHDNGLAMATGAGPGTQGTKGPGTLGPWIQPLKSFLIGERKRRAPKNDRDPFENFFFFNLHKQLASPLLKCAQQDKNNEHQTIKAPHTVLEITHPKNDLVMLGTYTLPPYQKAAMYYTPTLFLGNKKEQKDIEGHCIPSKSREMTVSTPAISWGRPSAISLDFFTPA